MHVLWVGGWVCGCGCGCMCCECGWVHVLWVWVGVHASVHVGCRLEISCACVWPWLSQRARDLFYGLWIPDLFMKRVEADKEWSLMCPHECPGLHEVWGEEFEQLYERCGSIVCLLAPVPPALALAPCAGL